MGLTCSLDRVSCKYLACIERELGVKTRFTESQIIGALEEARAACKIEDREPVALGLLCQVPSAIGEQMPACDEGGLPPDLIYI